ncbi:MAG: ribosomal protein S18-alanine N-acetyltransferase [Desulfitobacteriia bacterium]|jgi:ribosomal-protein-alanine N-acetyltransferase
MLAVEDIRIRPMAVDDIPTVIAIEEVSFSNPWSAESFYSELVRNIMARYYCLEIEKKVIGYIGFWVVLGEAHITNVAIWPGKRGQGWGEYLMRQVLRIMPGLGITKVTLEVRASNSKAQNLYRKLGFKPVGVRKGYYSDNREDAIIMWAQL